VQRRDPCVAGVSKREGVLAGGGRRDNPGRGLIGDPASTRGRGG